jgi:hypothetical protein
MKKIVFVLSLCLVSLQATLSFADGCNQAGRAQQRAQQLAKRNTFLDTKFSRSNSAPLYHREVARAHRVACRER